MLRGLFQPMHLILILFIALVVFGPGKLGDLGSSLGKAIKGFKKSMDEPEDTSAGTARAEKCEGQK